MNSTIQDTLKIVEEKLKSPPSPPGVWRTPSIPEERGVMEEERKKIRHGFFERRGILFH